MNPPTTQKRVRAAIRKRGPRTTEQLMRALGGVTRQRVHRVLFDMNDVIRLDLTADRGAHAKPVYGLRVSLTGRSYLGEPGAFAREAIRHG